MIKIKLILFVSTLLFLTSCSTFKRAEKKFENGEFDSAIDLYQQALKKDDNLAQALFSIAESYRLSNRLEAAEPYYKASIDSGYTEDEVYYNYSLSLKANSNYDKAKEVLENYLIDANNPEIKRLAEFQLKNLYNIDEILEDQTFYTVKKI